MPDSNNIFQDEILARFFIHEALMNQLFVSVFLGYEKPKEILKKYEFIIMSQIENDKSLSPKQAALARQEAERLFKTYYYYITDNCDIKH